MTTFFGFAIADSMFPADTIVARQALTLEAFVNELRKGVTSCCNGSHGATVTALNSLIAEHGVTVDIPPTPPIVKLDKGDSIIVMSVRGLPRLTDNRHFTPEEIAGATFVFGKWIVC
jgi:hypothetical protein